MKAWKTLAVGSITFLAAGFGRAQSSNMMNGGGWDMGWMNGYGGGWSLIVLIVVVVGAVTLVMQRKGK